MELPEPFDFIAAGGDLANTKTKVCFELYGMICYQGPNADHAIAIIKIADKKLWYMFNDQSVEVLGDDRCLHDDKVLKQDCWPALFFYRRI
jgi:ubiquitin C-terminal hydrolase